MSAIERLIDILAGAYRWGLHPLKVFVALVMPALIVWLADWRLRVRTRAIEQAEDRVRQQPHTLPR
ncbi:MAG TPA: hypothetical protein VJT85_01250 [Gemmatimonadaceae bacterium]|nr:hypothetical protein [Gemmatimonadaceae bacterium]